MLMCEQKLRYVLMDNPDSYRVEGGESGEETVEGPSTESEALIEFWLCRAGLPWRNDGDRCSLC